MADSAWNPRWLLVFSVPLHLSFSPSPMLHNPISQLLVKWSELSVNIYEFEEWSFCCGPRGEGKLGGIGRSRGEGKSSSEIRRGNHNPSTLHEKKILFSIKEKKERDPFVIWGGGDISASISALLPLSTEVGQTQWLKLNLNRLEYSGNSDVVKGRPPRWNWASKPD